jgi:adenosylcobinamide-phosphate synthase
MWPFPVFASAALAVIVERFVGYPDEVFARIGHPVVWIGRLIAFLDKKLNRIAADRQETRLRGAIALAVLVVAVFLPTWIIAQLLGGWRGGWIIEALLASSLIAQKSMRDHVLDVYRNLGKSLPKARIAVGKIVGRDPAHLDESGISKAALESLAENTSDGIVAPVFWYALLGLPGIAVYKAINTADSMIGHRTDRYLHFGWAAARIDDLVNLPCSRLAGVLFAAATPHRFREIFEVMRRDAPKHNSPNAGWPEASLAAALDLSFGGPRTYDGRHVDLPWMGEGRATMTRQDIKRGLKIYSRAMWLLFIGVFMLSLVF